MKTQNIWAAGRNYIEHAKELHNPVPKQPLIFLKAGSCIVTEDTEIELPDISNDIHHEIEVAYLLDENLKLSHVTLGIDFTARDIQEEVRSKGLPWTLAKSFKNACALGKWVPLKNLSNFDFNLKVNGELRQKANTKDMVFGIDALLKYVTHCYPVMPNDVILTGTPSGIAAVKPGDVLEGEIPGLLKTKWTIKRSSL